MEKIRARHQGKSHIYVHNDPFNAAHHYKGVIEAKLKADDRKGIAFDSMACLIMPAFTTEAKLNFRGHKLIDDWEERPSFNNKLTASFLVHLKLKPDWKARPFASIDGLKNFRDTIAHGKPVEIEYDKTVDLAEGQLERAVDLNAEWEEYCTPENAFSTYDDVDAIWKQLLDASGLTVYETLTHGEGGLSFVEKITQA